MNINTRIYCKNCKFCKEDELYDHVCKNKNTMLQEQGRGYYSPGLEYKYCQRCAIINKNNACPYFQEKSSFQKAFESFYMFIKVVGTITLIAFAVYVFYLDAKGGI